MLSRVHNDEFAIDKWCGISFNVDKGRFKIPANDKGVWFGCYATVETALAALKEHCQGGQFDADQQQVMLDDFQASIHFRDPEKAEADGKKIADVKSAAHYRTLIRFGGNVTDDEYTADWEALRDLFVQVIRKKDKDEDGEEEDDKKSKTHWHMRDFPTSGEPSLNGQFLPPRCTKPFIQFLREEFPMPHEGAPIIVYFPTRDKTMIAIGDPQQFNHGVNSKVTALFNTTVFGPVRVIKKLPIVLRGEAKGEDEAAAAAAPAEGDDVVMTDEPPKPPKKAKKPKKKAEKKEKKAKKMRALPKRARPEKKNKKPDSDKDEPKAKRARKPAQKKEKKQELADQTAAVEELLASI